MPASCYVYDSNVQRTLTKTRESTELRGAHFSAHNMVRPVGKVEIFLEQRKVLITQQNLRKFEFLKVPSRKIQIDKVTRMQPLSVLKIFLL